MVRKRRNIVLLVSSVLICFILCMCIMHYNNKTKMKVSTVAGTTLKAAYDNSTNGDALVLVDENFPVPHQSIFFLEVTNRGGLDPRQACSVESAARAHPQWQINVFFTSPVTENALNQSCLRILKNFRNVKFGRIHLEKFTEGTPIALIIKEKITEKSQCPIRTLANALRLVVLYKWGGIYLDTDIIVLKSLEPLGTNWVGKECDDYVNNAVLAFSRNKIGRNLVKDLLDEFQKSFECEPKFYQSWGWTGPQLLTRVLTSKWCHSKNSSLWSAATCNGLKVYGPEYFYPLHYTRKVEYFKAGALQNVDNAYTHHFWNKLTFDMKIEKDSPYAKMAKQFCPTIYEMYGEEFGS